MWGWRLVNDGSPRGEHGLILRFARTDSMDVKFRPRVRKKAYRVYLPSSTRYTITMTRVPIEKLLFYTIQSCMFTPLTVLADDFHRGFWLQSGFENSPTPNSEFLMRWHDVWIFIFFLMVFEFFIFVPCYLVRSLPYRGSNLEFNFAN